MKRETIKRTTEAVAFAGALLLGGTACAATGNVVATPAITAEVPAGAEVPASTTQLISVEAGTNLRFDPAVNTNADGGTNACKTLDSNIQFRTDEVRTEQGDSNGPWDGFLLAALPADVIDGSSCPDDQDGIIWIAQNLVDAQPVS